MVGYKKYWAYGVVGILLLILVRKWGLSDVVLGALIAFGGVIYTSRQNALERASDRDATNEQRQLDREMQLKREVLLPALSGGLLAESCLGGMLESTAEIGPVIERFQEGTRALAQVLLVGDAEATDAIMRYGQKLHEIWLIVVLERGAMDNLKMEAKRLEKQIAVHDEMQVGVLKTQQAVMSQPNADTGAFARLSDVFQSHERWKIDNQRALLKITLDLNERNATALERLLNEMESLSQMQIPVLRCLRREIGLDFDAAAFLAVHQAGRKKSTETLKRALSAARREIAIARARMAEPQPTDANYGNPT
ncbi:hypothetical protein [Pandoraea sputorum]|uniref:hypothetical protein n=1 Tax=Pandoraea sputorum TaxID=93222 RepID=UPI002B2E9F0E|nr:hypothetical protein THI4931_44750 [Pandoraea sputorum]